MDKTYQKLELSVARLKLFRLKTWLVVHGWAGILISLPFLITIITGIFLILRTYLTFMQPASVKLSQVHLDKVISPIAAQEHLPHKEWSSIILRPKKGTYSFRSNDGYEYVVDALSGDILNMGKKRTSLFIRLHEGSFWGASVRDFVFLPSAIVMLFMLFSGVYLFFKKTIKTGL